MEERAIGILKGCAWLNLVVGIALAIFVWMSQKPAGPIVMMGIVYAVAGIIGWALLLVVCSIAESLIEIRNSTAQPLKSRLLDRELR
jgi:vacuolar-type H+-ATPase subunit I/STV1